MSQHAFSAIAFVAASSFLAVSLSACASSEQHVSAPPVFYKGNGVAEFHSADIGGDALRGELPSEN